MLDSSQTHVFKPFTCTRKKRRWSHGKEHTEVSLFARILRRGGLSDILFPLADRSMNQFTFQTFLYHLTLLEHLSSFSNPNDSPDPNSAV